MSEESQVAVQNNTLTVLHLPPKAIYKVNKKTGKKVRNPETEKWIIRKMIKSIALAAGKNVKGTKDIAPATTKIPKSVWDELKDMKVVKNHMAPVRRRDKGGEMIVVRGPLITVKNAVAETDTDNDDNEE